MQEVFPGLRKDMEVMERGGFSLLRLGQGLGPRSRGGDVEGLSLLIHDSTLSS